MKPLHVLGLGAVSPAGWSVATLLDALHSRAKLPTSAIPRPGHASPHTARKVPAPPSRPPALTHPRLRRSSPISQFAVAAAVEALQPDTPSGVPPSRIGLVFCTMTGSVIYSRRFFDEALRDPATASPMLFPETVFNAPASHIAAVLNLAGRIHTEVGDASCFLKAITTAGLWLHSHAVDRCLLVAAEETDWLVSVGLGLLSHNAIAAEGAGALLLSRPDDVSPALARLENVLLSPSYSSTLSPTAASTGLLRDLMQSQPAADLLVDGAGTGDTFDAPERKARIGLPFPCVSPKEILGEAWSASTAWQCIAAVNAVALGPHRHALVTTSGTHELAAGTCFSRIHPPSPPTP